MDLALMWYVSLKKKKKKDVLIKLKTKKIALFL